MLFSSLTEFAGICTPSDTEMMARPRHQSHTLLYLSVGAAKGNQRVTKAIVPGLSFRGAEPESSDGQGSDGRCELANNLSNEKQKGVLR
jgi:hypothetical protein